MKNLRKLAAVLAAITLSAVSLTACKNVDREEKDKSENDVSVSESMASSENDNAETAVILDTDFDITATELFDESDLDASFSTPTANISLNGDTAEVDGDGAFYDNRKISITSGGVYVLSGKLNDGQVYVNTKEQVQLVLNGAEISCSDSSPVYIEDSENAVVTVCENTVNTLSDGTEYTYASGEINEPDAVIYSSDDLVLNGTGKLSITANYNEGITCKNDLRISGVTLDITSVGNAIKGKDSLAMRDVTANITSQSDGIKSSNYELEDKGFVVIESGTYNITATQDGIQAETDFLIRDGEVNITTGSGATESQGDGDMFRGGFHNQENTAEEETVSQKGIKSGRNLVISGGTVSASSADDAIHSNYTVEINGGTLNLAATDDGIHADTQVDINSGDVNITQSYEGIEAETINVNDGNIHLTASDDGFNASDGSGGNTMQASPSCVFNINGGYTYVNAGGDGLDSNGKLNVTGGTAIVDGPVNDGNGALDTGSSISVTGGTLIAAGSSGMAEVPDNTSAQNTLAVCFDTAQDAGSIVCVQNEKDESIVTFAPAKTYSSVIICSADIKQGETYNVYCGGSCSGTPTDGLYTDGEYSRGELLGTVTPESNVTTVGNGSLGAMGGGMGGMHGGFGGRGNKGNRGDFGGQMPQEDMQFPTDENGNPDMQKLGGMEMPEDFKNMTPPEGFENMTPPERFGDGMMPFEEPTENTTA